MTVFISVWSSSGRMVCDFVLAALHQCVYMELGSNATLGFSFDSPAYTAALLWLAIKICYPAKGAWHMQDNFAFLVCFILLIVGSPECSTGQSRTIPSFILQRQRPWDRWKLLCWCCYTGTPGQWFTDLCTKVWLYNLNKFVMLIATTVSSKLQPGVIATTVFTVQTLGNSNPGG